MVFSFLCYHVREVSNSISSLVSVKSNNTNVNELYGGACFVYTTLVK